MTAANKTQGLLIVLNTVTNTAAEALIKKVRFFICFLFHIVFEALADTEVFVYGEFLNHPNVKAVTLPFFSSSVDKCSFFCHSLSSQRHPKQRNY